MQTINPQTQNRQRSSLLVVLFILLASIYMLTYSARIESTDTLFLFDAAGSLVRFGDMQLAISAGVRPTPPSALPRGSLYPLPNLIAEPLQVILAAPLYWLADHLPGIGLVHGVYLFNIFVSAAAGVLLYLYALTLGYAPRVGLLAALLFGLGTIIWPYSKTFFQEPLALLLILSAALGLEKWRQSAYRRWRWLLLALLFAIGAVYSKTSSLLALPTLLLIAAPALPLNTPRQQRVIRAIILIGLALLLTMIVLLVLRVPLLTDPRQFGLTRAYASVALHSYLFSIGGSIWGTSPVLLLGLPGLWLWFQRGHYRYFLAALAMILGYAVTIALVSGSDWFGGLSWPPRFLVPVLPFGLLLALPFLEHALRSRWLRLIVALVFVYAFWAQLSGVTLDWMEYSRALPPESNGLGEWREGLNRVEYLRWVLLPPLWSQRPLDFAWVRVPVPLWPVLFGGLVALCVYLLFRTRLARPVSLALPLIFVTLTYGGLRAIHAVPFFQADKVALHTMLDIMETETQPGDVVLLSDLAYHPFFANYAKIDHPRIVSLPIHPGEQPSPEQAPKVYSDNPAVLLDKTSSPFVFALAAEHERLWLLASTGPFLPWSVRPVERFMAQQYYPIRVIETSPQVRLLEYSTVPAPDPLAFRGPNRVTDLVYDERIHLAGYELPLGTSYQAGVLLPLSLYWLSVEPLEQSYKVAWFVRAEDGAPIAQGWVLEPGGGFFSTDQWRLGVPVWDNRALYLPGDLPAGTYRLWIVLYAANPDGTIHNLPVTGSETREGFIGMLPTSIQVE